MLDNQKVSIPSRIWNRSMLEMQCASLSSKKASRKGRSYNEPCITYTFWELHGSQAPQVPSQTQTGNPWLDPRWSHPGWWQCLRARSWCCCRWWRTASRSHSTAVKSRSNSRTPAVPAMRLTFQSRDPPVALRQALCLLCYFTTMFTLW